MDRFILLRSSSYYNQPNHYEKEFGSFSCRCTPPGAYAVLWHPCRLRIPVPAHCGWFQSGSSRVRVRRDRVREVRRVLVAPVVREVREAPVAK